MSKHYVIGDLHGRYDLLLKVLDFVKDTDYHIFSLGDLVDRGPQSKEVVIKILELQVKGNLTLLLGNHEMLMYAALCKPTPGDMECWLSNGGQATLDSFGSLNAAEEAIKALWYHVQDWSIYKDILLSHAAVPDPVLFNNSGYRVTQDHLWNRPNDKAHPLPRSCRMSIHGHTPMKGPSWDDRNKRWFIDLGSFHTGKICLFDLYKNVPHVLSA